MSSEERTKLFSRISTTETGRMVVKEFKEKYGSLEQLILQWDLVSYSQILRDPETSAPNRTIASLPKVNDDASAVVEKKSTESKIEKKIVCIHLTKRLPEIEHLADLVHEMTHANRLTQEALKGDEESTEKFVSSRIAGLGGEAEAFATECKMKNEILKSWDALCAPYAKNSEEIDFDRVVSGLYSGTLSASLTGEPYPVMLRKQFRNIQLRKELKKIEKLKNSGIQ